MQVLVRDEPCLQGSHRLPRDVELLVGGPIAADARAGDHGAAVAALVGQQRRVGADHRGQLQPWAGHPGGLRRVCHHRRAVQLAAHRQPAGRVVGLAQPDRAPQRQREPRPLEVAVQDHHVEVLPISPHSHVVPTRVGAAPRPQHHQRDAGGDQGVGHVRPGRAGRGRAQGVAGEQADGQADEEAQGLRGARAARADRADQRRRGHDQPGDHVPSRTAHQPGDGHERDGRAQQRVRRVGQLLVDRRPRERHVEGVGAVLPHGGGDQGQGDRRDRHGGQRLEELAPASAHQQRDGRGQRQHHDAQAGQGAQGAPDDVGQRPLGVGEVVVDRDHRLLGGDRQQDHQQRGGQRQDRAEQVTRAAQARAEEPLLDHEGRVGGGGGHGGRGGGGRGGGGGVAAWWRRRWVARGGGGVAAGVVAAAVGGSGVAAVGGAHSAVLAGEVGAVAGGVPNPLGSNSSSRSGATGFVGRSVTPRCCHVPAQRAGIAPHPAPTAPPLASRELRCVSFARHGVALQLRTSNRPKRNATGAEVRRHRSRIPGGAPGARRMWLRSTGPGRPLRPLPTASMALGASRHLGRASPRRPMRRWEQLLDQELHLRTGSVDPRQVGLREVQDSLGSVEVAQVGQSRMSSASRSTRAA